MDLLVSVLPFVLIMGVMYFFMIRPQQRQAQEKQQMLQALKKGDAIVTIGGLHGIVEEVDLANRLVVLDCEGIYLTYELSAVATIKQGERVRPSVADLEPKEEVSNEEA